MGDWINMKMLYCFSQNRKCINDSLFIGNPYIFYAPEDAVVRNTEDNAGEDGSEEGSDQTPAEDKTE